MFSEWDVRQWQSRTVRLMGLHTRGFGCDDKRQSRSIGRIRGIMIGVGKSSWLLVALGRVFRQSTSQDAKQARG